MLGAWFERFRATVQAIPEVVEFYRMSGDVGYLLRVVVPDIAAYDAVYKRLSAGMQRFDVGSSFEIEQLKFTKALPLDFCVEWVSGARACGFRFRGPGVPVCPDQGCATRWWAQCNRCVGLRSIAGARLGQSSGSNVPKAEVPDPW